MTGKKLTIYVPVTRRGTVLGSCASDKAFRAKYNLSHAKGQSWRSLYELGFRIVRFSGKRKAEGGLK